MKFSKRVYYGLVFLMQLHYTWPSYKTVKELAESDGLPHKFLEGIAADLRKGGFIDVKRGSMGGYRLAKTLKEISLLDVILCLEVDWGHNEKIEARKVNASDKQMIISEFLNDTSESIKKVLSEIFLDSLPQRYSGDDSIMYYI